MISTDAFVAEVDPLTCLNCEVPKVIREPRCRFLSLGTELRPYRGESHLVIAMACKELGIRIYNLNTCQKCNLYSEVPSVVEELKQNKEKAEVQLVLSPEAVNRVVEIVRKERAGGEFSQETEEPPFRLMCWRFEDGHCRKIPVYTQRKVSIILQRNPRNDEVFDRAIQPALKDLNLIPYRLVEELDNEEELCRACENIQESDFVVVNFEDWSSNLIFLLGLVQGIGRRLAVLRRSSAAVTPLTEVISQCVLEYSTLPEIVFLLKHRFSSLVKHTQGRSGCWHSRCRRHCASYA